MYRQVLKDKTKIEETVATLDEFKKEALQTTWEKVNASASRSTTRTRSPLLTFDAPCDLREFGNIFAELLPGNFSKLQPPEGMDITQGLEVKVRLGTVWKASLTELSGGQRSLIALSLIMALLHFKPAPMYILDEIDAALDLSHSKGSPYHSLLVAVADAALHPQPRTLGDCSGPGSRARSSSSVSRSASILSLLGDHYHAGSFADLTPPLPVSLKDGLFSNANVLFRARFRDGTASSCPPMFSKRPSS